MMSDAFRREIREFLSSITASNIDHFARHPVCLLSESVLASLTSHFNVCLENYIVFANKITFTLMVAISC